MKTQPNKDVVGFHGVDILTFTQHHQHFIAIKPLCEQFGIAWQPQHRKLKNDNLFSSTITTTVTVGADGHRREMTCLPLEVFPMWLARITTSRVQSPQAVELILDFQREATQVLYEHFMGGRLTTPGAVRKMVRRELAKERLAEYLYCSDIWTGETINRLVQLKGHRDLDITNNELARMFQCSASTIRKAYRLMRHAKGDFTDTRPENLKPDTPPQLELTDGMVKIPATGEDKAEIWRMRAVDEITYHKIADITGYSVKACRDFYQKQALRRGADYDND